MYKSKAIDKMKSVIVKDSRLQAKFIYAIVCLDKAYAADDPIWIAFGTVRTSDMEVMMQTLCKRFESIMDKSILDQIEAKLLDERVKNGNLRYL